MSNTMERVKPLYSLFKSIKSISLYVFDKTYLKTMLLKLWMNEACASFRSKSSLVNISKKKETLCNVRGMNRITC